MIFLDRRFLDDRIGLQVCEVPQLCLARAEVAQAFHDVADFGIWSQATVRRA